ncbi:hypothetical protein [Streptomyces justiciae]|uniref:hypothetical protein n=1 Tax=Streptomyces justiciae TaxID=2780140 RepID=UPI002118E913|nr:hypothetical protein [Streptomyces justiciae]MCW8382396.1 hypothetical protein [Streptomyces justiciae]
MHNNLIYLTDGRGKVDASLLSGPAWNQLVADNRDSTRRQLVKCAWCWDEDQVTHWMRTYSLSNTTRVVAHQPGEAADHPYQALESDEHKAYCDRVERVGVTEGFTAQREARARDGLTRSDVLLVGSRQVSYEMQHSPFKPGYGATERTRRTLAAQRDAVAWHTDSALIADRARVAVLRSNQARRPQIENPRYAIRILGGYRKVVTWDCTVREGHRCPHRRFAGCGEVHVRTEPTGITLDDFIRQAPAGLLMPVQPLDRLGFWTTAHDYELWREHAGSVGTSTSRRAAPGRPAHPEAEGHSRRTAAEDHAPAGPQHAAEPPAADEAPDELVTLQRAVLQEHAQLTGLDGDAHSAQWKRWRTTAEEFQAALTGYATRTGLSRPAVEQAVKRAARQPRPDG